ncbi:hypothetical protein FDP41_000013 [Naegleria fowleri]|uniref:RGS domain-containing protein n=1 Tax=Naegleria fowleri TaxID=5763 RepID=A0A6A5CEG0_NAEFO|nr:uncharacterized protein FDP41_000013 [Naegleria fowleri]KAF0984974.1 hypothetical protein FDP41_000013 [Naegleria fowleri]
MMKRLLSSLSQQHEMVLATSNGSNGQFMMVHTDSSLYHGTSPTTTIPRCSEQLLGTTSLTTATHRASHTFHSNNTLSVASSGRNRSLSNSSSTAPLQHMTPSSSHGHRCHSPPTSSGSSSGSGAGSPHNNHNNNHNTLHAQLYSLQQQQKNEALHLKHIQVAKLYKYNFEDLYDCLEVRVLFKQFLIKNQNEENYYFDQILDTEYKKLKSNRNRYQMAKRMIETFVKAGAPYELNLSEKIKQSVLREFQKATPENCPLDMFDSIQYQVLTSMRLDAYPRFIQSDEFLSFIGGKISSFKNVQQKLRFIKSIGAIKKVTPLEKSSSKGDLRESINAKKKSEDESVKESLMMDQIDMEDNSPENLILPVEEILGGFEALHFMSPTPTSTTTCCQSSNLTTSPPVSTVATNTTSSNEISEPSSIKRSMSSIIGHLFNKQSPNTNSNSTTSTIQPYIHTTRTRNTSGSACDLNFHDSPAGSSNNKSAIAIRLHDSLPRAIAPINNFIVTPCSDDEKDDDEDDENEVSEDDENELTPTEHERVKNFDIIIHKSSLFEKSLSSERPFCESSLEQNDQHLWDEVDTCLSDESSEEEDEDDNEKDDELEDEIIGGNLAAAAKQITVSTAAVANNTVIPLLETLNAYMDKLQLTVNEIDIVKTEYQNYMNNYSCLELNTILKQVDSTPDSKKDNDWTMIKLEPKTRRRSILNRNQPNKSMDFVSQYNLKAHFARFDSPVSDDVTYMLRRSCKLPYNAFSVLQLLCDESSYETMVNPLLLAPAEYIEFVVKDTEHSYASLISLEGAKWPWPLKQRHYVTTGTVISDILNDEKENPNRKRYIILKRSVINNAKVEITLNKKENPNRVIGVKLEAYFVESSIANECTLTMFNEWRFTNVNKWTFPSKLFKKSLKLFTNDFHHALIDKLSSATVLHATSYSDFINNSQDQEHHSPNTKKDNTLLHTLFRNDALPKKDEMKSKVKNIFHTLSLMKLFEYDLNETCRVIEERQHANFPIEHQISADQPLSQEPIK